jgi:hypothetical protein
LPLGTAECRIWREQRRWSPAQQRVDADRVEIAGGLLRWLYREGGLETRQKIGLAERRPAAYAPQDPETSYPAASAGAANRSGRK